MPDFCTFGQELLLWKGFCYGNMGVKVFIQKLVSTLKYSFASHIRHYLDFSPISRSINVVDITLTNTKDGLPAEINKTIPARLALRSLPICSHKGSMY
jgi:hypothetical protein